MVNGIPSFRVGYEGSKFRQFSVALDSPRVSSWREMDIKIKFHALGTPDYDFNFRIVPASGVSF